MRTTAGNTASPGTLLRKWSTYSTYSSAVDRPLIARVVVVAWSVSAIQSDLPARSVRVTAHPMLASYRPGMCHRSRQLEPTCSNLSNYRPRPGGHLGRFRGGNIRRRLLPSTGLLLAALVLAGCASQETPEPSASAPDSEPAGTTPRWLAIARRPSPCCPRSRHQRDFSSEFGYVRKTDNRIAAKNVGDRRHIRS